MADDRASSDDLDRKPNLNIPEPLRLDDNGNGGSRHSSEETDEKNPGTPEERFQAVERTRIERNALEAVLEQQCDELNEYVLNRGRRSINHLKS
jgi:hypothetical protein